MQHEMRLSPDSFDNVKIGKKDIEIRLLDEKRKKVRIGDSIKFSKLPDLREALIAQVLEIRTYPTYYEVVESTPINNFSGDSNDKEEILRKGCAIYSQENQDKFGFVTYKLKLI